MPTVPDARDDASVARASSQLQRLNFDKPQRLRGRLSGLRARRKSHVRYVYTHARTRIRTELSPAPAFRRQTLHVPRAPQTPAPSRAAARCPASSPRPRDAPSRAWSRARPVAASSPANTSNSATKCPKTAATSACFTPVFLLARPRIRSRTMTDVWRFVLARVSPGRVDDGSRTRIRSACTASSWRR